MTMDSHGLDWVNAPPEEVRARSLERLHAIREEGEELRSPEERAAAREEFKDELRHLMKQTSEPEFHRLAREVIEGRMSRFTLYGTSSYRQVLHDNHNRFIREAAAQGVDIEGAARRTLEEQGHHHLLALMKHFDES